jgi:hypothetical protein
MVPVQEHRTPCDATADDGGVEGASRVAPPPSTRCDGGGVEGASQAAPPPSTRFDSGGVVRRRRGHGKGRRGQGMEGGIARCLLRWGRGRTRLGEPGTRETGLWARVAQKGRTVRQPTLLA